MQHKSETEKVAAMATAYTPVSQTPVISPTDDPQIQRTRKIFIIILGVCFGLSVVSMFYATFGYGNILAVIFGSADHIESAKAEGGSQIIQALVSIIFYGLAQRGSQIGQALVSIIFYGFGIFAAHRYSALALRIFAWLCVIAVVAMGITIIFFIFIGIIGLIDAASIDKARDKQVTVGASLAVLFTAGICIAAVILSIIIIKLAFKLARLIDTNNNVIVQQS